MVIGNFTVTPSYDGDKLILTVTDTAEVLSHMGILRAVLEDARTLFGAVAQNRADLVTDENDAQYDLWADWLFTKSAKTLEITFDNTKTELDSTTAVTVAVPYAG
jgi:hypothetical protein